MKILAISLKDGIQQKKVEFNESANVINSETNSAGKTTFLRSIFYALGYAIPSTKGIKFEKMEFWITIQNGSKQYKLYRRNSYLLVDDGDKKMDFSLPTDFQQVQTIITGCSNKDVLDNLLGTCYMDQEKGWTLLNRGKVIGNISFNIEALVRGLGGKTCTDDLQRLEALKRQLKKYEYMYSVAEYQEAIRDECGDIDYNTPDEIKIRQIEVLRSEKEQLMDELKQIKGILRKNHQFVQYISDMKLTVKTSNGVEVPVTKETLVGFADNTEVLTTRREILETNLCDINKRINVLESDRNQEMQLDEVETMVGKFDMNINKISVDPIAVKDVIENLKKNRKKLQERITEKTKKNNSVVDELHNCISTYAKELGVDETYVSPNRDYIFTNDLKSLSGTILHKIVFSFKLAYIKLIQEKEGLILPIVLDSPTGREVRHDTVEQMLKIVQRDYPEHQLIVASIYDFDLRDKKRIEFKDRLFNTDDIMDMS